MELSLALKEIENTVLTKQNELNALKLSLEILKTTYAPELTSIDNLSHENDLLTADIANIIREKNALVLEKNTLESEKNTLIEKEESLIAELAKMQEIVDTTPTEQYETKIR